jgi:hypothetical protein
MSEAAIILAGIVSLFFSFVYYRMERANRQLEPKEENVHKIVAAQEINTRKLFSQD